MSENIDGGSAETTEASASGEVDAQLAEMQTAETAESEPVKEEERPEVKKVVPLAALHEERRERQRLAAQLAESSRAHAEQMALINQRLEMLTTPQRQVPTRDEDPVGYIDHRLDGISQRQEQILSKEQEREQLAVQRAQYERVASHVIQTADAFEKVAPDFRDAVAHLNETRTRQLVVLGMPESEAREKATLELNEAAVTWTVQGRNAAQVAYEFAKAQGYQMKTQTPDQKIAAQQKGTAAARSLGGGGAVSAGKLTAEALVNMSDEDFSKLSQSEWRTAMGG